jgi:hypothetical protein
MITLSMITLSGFCCILYWHKCVRCPVPSNFTWIKKENQTKRSNFWFLYLFPMLLVIHESIHKSELIRIRMLEQDQLQREDRMIGVRLANVGFEVHRFFFLKIINNFNLFVQTDLNFAWVLLFYLLQSLKRMKKCFFFLISCCQLLNL